MSLYEGVGGPSGGKIRERTPEPAPPEATPQSQKKAAPNSWQDAGLRLLQSQLIRKKAAATQAMRERGKVPRSVGGPVAEAAPVIDLSSRTRERLVATTPSTSRESEPAKKSLLKPRKPLVVESLPLSFIPTLAKEETLMFNEYTVKDEYDPMKPNDYTIQSARREVQKRLAREEERRKEVEARRRKLEERDRIDEQAEVERETRKRQMGAAIAPPQALIEADSRKLTDPEPSSAAYKAKFGGGLNAAAKMMEKMGYKEGTGLGAKGQGITTALRVEKHGWNAGRIIYENDAEEVREALEEENAQAAELQNAQGFSITELLKSPTKVVLLKNMVGRGEVDDELDPEVREEMAKFGEVTDLHILERPPPVPENEAVRIFVEFRTVDHAIKAAVALNGRFFGGRMVRVTFYDPEKFARDELTD